jgi:hypothetical protein
VESETQRALDERLVSFSELKIAEPSFPTLPARHGQDCRRGDHRAMPLDERVIALDACCEHRQEPDLPKNVEGVKADPPPIFFSQTPRARQHRRSRSGPIRKTI